MEAWTLLCVSIVNGGLDVDCLPIIDWLCVSLTLNNGNNKLPLSIPRPTVPLADEDLLRHRYHMLTRNLPGIDLTLQRVQGSLIATHIGEVSLEMNRDR